MDRTPAALTVTIELHLDEHAFTGRAHDQLGAERDFSGWLGLIAAMDELIDTAPARIRDADNRDHGPEDAPC